MGTATKDRGTSMDDTDKLLYSELELVEFRYYIKIDTSGVGLDITVKLGERRVTVGMEQAVNVIKRLCKKPPISDTEFSSRGAVSLHTVLLIIS
ncbi:hypothetical protein Tco_1264419 [Tanacetum coccineum]